VHTVSRQCVTLLSPGLGDLLALQNLKVSDASFAKALEVPKMFSEKLLEQLLLATARTFLQWEVRKPKMELTGFPSHHTVAIPT
jgi:hypothetical protein